MSEHECESSTEDLIKSENDGSLSEAESYDLFIARVRHKIRIVTVEPLLMLFIIIMIIQGNVNNQYIYYRVGVDYNIVVNETSAHVCEIGFNNSEKKITDRIQALNAQYSMFIQLSTAVCTILTAPFYCVFSDRFGRKIMFLLPGVGIFLKTVLEILIQFYKLNLKWFIVAEGLYGLSGGYVFVISLCYSYMADISTQKNRTKRMAMLGVTISISALVASLIAAYWIKVSGYLIPYIFTGLLCGVSIIYPILLLKDPPKMPSAKLSKPPLIAQLKNLVLIYTNNYPEKKTLLVIVLILLNFYYVSEMSTVIIAHTYLMSYPICMDIVQIGIFIFVHMLANNIGVAITVLFLSRWISDLLLVFLCIISGVIFSLQMAFATTPTGVFIAASTNILSFAAFPFIRGYLSKMISYQDQGALFGGIALTETMSGSVIKVISIYFYGATFHILHGMVYLLLTGFSVVAIILTLSAFSLDRKLKMIEKTKVIN